MKKNDILLLASVALYSYLFYGQSAGINFLIFSIALVSMIFIRKPSLITDRPWIFAALGSIASSVAVVMYGNTLSVISNLISLSLLASFSINKNSSLILALLYALYSYLSSIAFMVIHLFEKKLSDTSQKNSLTTKSTLMIVPLVITIAFFFLYREANPVFKNFTENLRFDFITWPWVRFTLAGFLLLYGFFNQRNILYLFNKDLEASDSLNIGSLEDNGIFSGEENGKENENLSGIILFGLLNLLLLSVNILDINFLWITQSVPEDMTYSEFVHQGVGLLIVSILIAIAIILYYFRGGLNFYEKNTVLKLLAYAWIIQNALLIITTAYKNGLYVNEFSLTYKRIGVFVYLLLSLAGLVTTFIKIIQIKSNWFLFRKNGWIFYSLLIAGCFINWDRLIIGYNVEHSKELDKDYLLSLSASTLPDLIKQAVPENNSTGIIEPSVLRPLHTKTYDFLLNRNNSEWQSWNMEDEKIQEEILSLEQKGMINDLNLSDNKINDLRPLRMFSLMKMLDVSINNIENLGQLSYFPELEKVNLSDNKITGIDQLPALPKLKSIDLSSNRLHTISTLARTKNLEELILQSNSGKIDSYPELPHLKALNLSGTEVADYNFPHFKKLKSLQLNNINKKRLGTLPHLPELETISLSGNNLNSSDEFVFSRLSGYKNLKTLNLSRNNLSSIESIAFEGNQITHLNLRQNDLKNIKGIEKYTALQSLDLSNCSLTNITLLGMTPLLTSLDLTANRITNLHGLSGLVNLKKLDLTANRINEISALQNLVRLEVLDLDGNSISDITALKKLQNLKKLNLENNSIFDYSPIASLKNLESLQLTFVTDDMVKMIAQLKHLKELKCENLTDVQIKELKTAIPGLIIMTINGEIKDFSVVEAQENSSL